MNELNIVHSIITTKKPDDWLDIRQKVKSKYSKDIANFVPVFLTLKDFEIHHDPSFNASDILISWWQYGKMPIILLKDMNEWNNLDKTKKMILENTSVFIN